MEKIKYSVRNITKYLSQQQPSRIDHQHLLNVGLCTITPHDYQLLGINWLVDAYNVSNEIGGVILGDEMGLGKTLQTVSFLLCQKENECSKPTLILSPLAVIDSWRQELKRCAPSLKMHSFIGSKEDRENVKDNIKSQHNSTNWNNLPSPFDIILTSYEICMKEKEFLKRFHWKVLVVDEAHRLKNAESVLYNDLSEFRIKFKVLLTGTPVQNNLKEIYSLLSFISSKIFPTDSCDQFVDYFTSITKDDTSSSNRKQELHDLIKPFLLRRTKNEVLTDIPNKSEVLLYCGMTAEQKKIYKAILTKDTGLFTHPGGQKPRLMNTLMQLRKCCNHPYIFPGIEPEPFQLGEHLVETSGKLYLLDKLLITLKNSGHKVLLFSQMTTMLDIIQDYLGYRGFTYERLDGSVRGEERFLAVNNFNKTTDTFLFLLSTRAGGQGLNLMSADTVIFVDNDFNPQNDLQAAARAHRIGQTSLIYNDYEDFTFVYIGYMYSILQDGWNSSSLYANRPVKIIRLVAKNTVEEIILNRANSKLSLTDTVIEGGQFSNVSSTENTPLNSILKFGLEDLLNSDDNSYKHIDFEKILGKSVNGKWVSDKLPISQPLDDEKLIDEESKPENMYVYEGLDYSKVDASAEDNAAFEEMIKDLTESFQGERSLRKDRKVTAIYLPESTKRKRRLLTDEEKEERRKKTDENHGKRLKLLAEESKVKLEKLWSKNNYTSCNIELPAESDSESSCSDDFIHDDTAKINYMVGDVTAPQNVGRNDAIVIHCLDDSGYWGSGGLFTAINNKSGTPKEQYELSCKMKDLSLGDLHLVKMKNLSDNHAVYVGLIVAHKRDSNNQISPLLMKHLNEGLEKCFHIAKKTGASIHLPRIGYNTPNFNWYGTEKLIKKIFTQRNIPTYIYYYKRHKSTQQAATSSYVTTITSVAVSTLPVEEENISDSKGQSDTDQALLPDVFSNCCVYFDKSTYDKQLSRYVIAYDGEIDEEISTHTTHVICSPQVIHTLQSINSNCKFVTKEWIEDCVKHQKLLNENMYSVMNSNIL